MRECAWCHEQFSARRRDQRFCKAYCRQRHFSRLQSRRGFFRGATYQDWKFRKQYGITIDDYLDLFDRQHGLCAICRQPETDKYPDGQPKRLAVDHDHQTGQVRGLLCRACNTGMGTLGDDPVRLRAAAEYLEAVH